MGVRWVPADDPTRHGVGFAIGRSVGPAVVRNRRRRQLRAILADLPREWFPPGLYLFSLAPTDATYQELRRWVIEALRRLPRSVPD